MRDYVDIGCTPWEERCAQTAEPDFRERARKEEEEHACVGNH